MNGDTCERCHYGQLEHKMIKCRRLPPTLLAIKYVQQDHPQIESYYLYMGLDEWCGEFKDKA